MTLDRFVLLVAAGGFGASAMGATAIDLTAPASSATINGAIFRAAAFGPAGTGVMNTFVRIKANGTEEGYNTSGRPVQFDERRDRHTRDLTLGEVGVVTIEGVAYREFMLDIHERASRRGRMLSLDALQIYTSDEGGQITTDVSSLGDLVYDLDEGLDSWIRLDGSLNPGSGVGDMLMYIAESAFDGVGDDDFVYLFSRFGDHERSDATFEEWGVRATETPEEAQLVPSAAAAGVWLAALAGSRRRRR